MSPHEQAQLYLDGRLSPEERAAFDVHLAACSECQALVHSWRDFSTKFQAETAPLLGPPDDLSTRRLLKRAGATGRAQRVVIAVALAAAAVVTFFFARRPAPAPRALAVLEAATGPRRETLGDDTIALTAGSAVELGAQTDTQVDLKLLRGSVAASVKKRAPGKVFVVRSGEYEVKVVGTKFRVERQADGVRVSVAEGLVRVSTHGAQYDVAAGEQLELHSTQVSRTPFAPTGFQELGDVEPTPPLVVDAGAPEPEAELDAGLPPPVAAKPISAAQLAAWRQAAATNQCTALLPELQRAASSHRRQAAVWRVLGDCQRLTKDAKSARSSYEQVIAVGTGDDAARAPVLAALLQEDLGAHEAAIRVLTEYLRGKPSPVLEAAARVRLARSYLALGQKPRARKELERVVKELPSSPPALEALELLKAL